MVATARRKWTLSYVAAGQGLSRGIWHALYAATRAGGHGSIPVAFIRGEIPQVVLSYEDFQRLVRNSTIVEPKSVEEDGWCNGYSG